MTFLGKVWRLLVGIKDALVLMAMLLFFGLLYALLSATPNPEAVEEGALYVALEGSIVEQPEHVSPEELLLNSSMPMRERRLRDVVHGLETAASDPRIKIVALDLDGFWGGGQVALQRVGAAMDKVRKAGKPVIAYASAYSDDSYALAAHASEIWMDPMGAVLIAGPGGSQPYFKGLIDRLGVNVRVYRVGKFKSFVEPFVRSDQSPEAKQASQTLANALFSNWKTNVASARPKAKLSSYVSDPVGTASTGSLAKRALQAGMVDRLGDRIAWAKRIAKVAGNDDSGTADGFRGTDFGTYLAANPVPSDGQIGVITIAGDIVDGEAPAGSAGGDTISRLILDALSQQQLKALVVRIDSPGGSAMASENMRRAIVQAKRNGLPVVVSMGNVAASGGYWVATAGDRIFAEPGTITGSIGVFGIVPTFEKTLAKTGITADGVATTPLTGQPDLLRGTTPIVDQLLQKGVNDIYQRFTGLVAAERKLSLTRVNEIAQGRVWDGGTARQLGLVDQFGGLEDAIAEAGRRAGLSPEEARPLYIDRMPNWFELYAHNLQRSDARTDMPRDAYSRMILRQQANLASGLGTGLSVLSGPSVQVRCLSCPTLPRLKAREGFWKALLERLSN